MGGGGRSFACTNESLQSKCLVETESKNPSCCPGTVTLLHGHVRWEPSSVTVAQGRSRIRREDGGVEPKRWGATTGVLVLCFPADCVVCLCTINLGVRFYFSALAGR